MGMPSLNAWAERRHVTVIIIHHTRKTKAEDIFEEISGTAAIVGAVATAMVLARSADVPDEQLLHMIGRDLLEDDPIALKWDFYTCQHIYVATGAEASSSTARRAILAAMEDTTEYPLKQIAALVHKTVSNVSNQLKRLMDDNLIHRVGNGRYAKVVKWSESSESDEQSESSESSESGREDRQDIHRLSLLKSESESESESADALSERANGNFHYFHSDSQESQKPSKIDAGVPRDHVNLPQSKDMIARLQKQIAQHKAKEQDEL